MQPTEEKIERRIVFELEVGADTMRDLASCLMNLAHQLDRFEHEPKEGWRSVSGGYSSGYVAKIRINPEMDGDKYRVWLEKHHQ